MVVTFGLAFFVYSYYYNIDGLNLDHSLSDTFEAEVKVHSNSLLQANDYDIKEGLTVDYTYEKLHNQYQGSAILEKGMNKKYRIVNHKTIKDESQISFKIKDKSKINYIQFYGEIDEVNEITFYTTHSGPIAIDMTQYQLTEEIAINFEPEDIEYYIITTEGYSKKYGVLTAEDPYIFNGQTIFIYMPIALIIMFGFIFFSIFSKETNLLEGFFNRLTRIKSKD